MKFKKGDLVTSTYVKGPVFVVSHYSYDRQSGNDICIVYPQGHPAKKMQVSASHLLKVENESLTLKKLKVWRKKLYSLDI